MHLGIDPAREEALLWVAAIALEDGAASRGLRGHLSTPPCSFCLGNPLWNIIMGEGRGNENDHSARLGLPLSGRGACVCCGECECHAGQYAYLSEMIKRLRRDGAA